MIPLDIIPSLPNGRSGDSSAAAQGAGSLGEAAVRANHRIRGGSPDGSPGAPEIPPDFGLLYDRRQAEAHPLSDGFGRLHTYLRISVAEQCNLRCGYCMPEEGLDWTPSEQLLTSEEIVRLAHLFVMQGVTKIRLTGGEPLVRPDIEAVAAGIGRLMRDPRIDPPGVSHGAIRLQTLAITTNGLLLPKKIKLLTAAGVNLINISLDTLRPDRFEAITRRRGFDLVLRAIEEAIRYGFSPVKINCVVQRGVNDDELIDFAAWTETLPIEMRFIEFMPFDGNRWNDEYFVSFSEMRARIEDHFQLEPFGGGTHETAKTFRIPGFRGTLGFISSMSENFCEGCNRLRITADGHLKVCLFGQAEVSLRDPMRRGATDDELIELINTAVGRKHARHAGMHNLVAMKNRPMIMIGG